MVKKKVTQFPQVDRSKPTYERQSKIIIPPKVNHNINVKEVFELTNTSEKKKKNVKEQKKKKKELMTICNYLPIYLSYSAFAVS